MRRVLAQACILAAVVVGATLDARPRALSAQAPTPSISPFARMVDTERAFAARALEVGWKAAFLEYFADDALGFDQGAVGLAKDQIASSPAPSEGATLRWEPRLGDIAGSGELGYLTGPVQSQARGRPVRHQVYASIWKQQRDGTFRVVMDVGIPTPRAAAFPAGLTQLPATNRFSGDYDDRTPPLAAADGVLNSALKAGQAKGYRGRLAPQVRFHRPGRLPVVGPAAVLAWAASQPRLTLVDSRYAESARSGDLGYTWGTYQVASAVSRPQGAGRGASAARGLEEGFYVRVWTRERTGQWQVALDVWQPQFTGN